MACTFVHKKFSHRAPDDKKLLRCFFSSSRMPDLLTHSDEALQQIARQELKEILGADRRAQVCANFPLGPRHGAI